MTRVKLLGYKELDYNKKRLKNEYQEEEQEQEEHFIVKLIRLCFSFAKFSLYICVTLLELLLKIIRTLFLNEYVPLENIIDNIKYKRALKQEKQINEYLSQNRGAKIEHTYEFKHSETFSSSYKILVERIIQISENKLTLNEELKLDTINRIKLIIQECESVGLAEGYKYAKETNYKFDNEEDIYNYFICDRVHRNL